MKPALYLFSAILAVSFGLSAGEVTVQKDCITLPTYAPGGYDKTPLFYTGRVYQGAQGRVYPYPMQDVLHDEKVDEKYTYLTLENDWFQMGLLPEHGGHLLNFTDKQTGFETFYRQHVIKPALIGMLGAWISGGVEWNFPHHHRATTAMPIDWRFTASKDGTKTIWIGETELRRRLKWTIGLSLLPDRAVLKAENIFMNRQPWIESMIYWANVSVHCGDDYQILFPPSMHLGFDHHKNYWTSFPIGPRKEELELLPSQRSKYADDISGTMDLSWWKNFTIESRSIFGMDPDNAFMAGYDHKKQCGTAHVSNRHITVGKKFFLWGNFPEAHVWDTVLTDNDGPYLELMVGCWSDNQPDYSWIAPYETRKVEQFWFPVKGIGGIKNVTIDGAVNVDRLADDKLLVGFHSTRVLKDCTITLFKDREAVFTEKGVAIDPNTPWCKTVAAEKGVADQRYTAAIADASGKVFLSYTPVPPQGDVELPPKVENPKPPKEYASAELVYEIGLRLDQFQNGLIDPEPYYKRALEIDPDYSKANLAMGVRLAKNGSYAEAKPYLEKAVARATQNHTRALDAAPEYYLALVEKALGDLKRAEDLFWRCTWRLTHKKESYVELARIAALKGDWEEALARIDDALALGQDEAKLWTLKGIFLRKLSNSNSELQLALQRAIQCDPLEYWAVVEKDGFEAAEKNRGLKAQQLLECVSDYWGIGCYDEVIALCDAALAKAAVEKPYATEGALPLKDTIAACDSYKNALFGYFKGAALEKVGVQSSSSREDVENSTLQLQLETPTQFSNSNSRLQLARDAYAAASAMPTDYCFPNRLEEEEVLMMAAKSAPELANTWYYLGCCEWNHDRKEAGLADWKRCVELCEAAHPVNPVNPVQKPSSYALALRCIGFALSHPGTYFTNTGVPSGIASREAYDYYLKSLESDPGNFRTLDEAGKLAEKLNLPAAERLALMEKYKETVYKYDPCVLRLAYTYNAVGRFAEAHEILTTRRFHVWEGADGLLAPFVESCIGLGKAAMEKGDCKTALRFFEESTTYPANLQAGRPGDAGTEPKSRYFMAQCKKALGDDAGYRAELENSLKGWIHAGEMDYWRVKALRELGRDAETAPLIAELQSAIMELETPAPVVINAYAKFAGDNSAMERAAKAREKANFLRGLLEEIKPKEATAAEWISVPSAPVYSGPVRDGSRAADGTSWFVRSFTNEGEIVSAKWVVSGLGVFDVYVNGKLVGNDFLKPGFTHWRKTKYSFSYDVTPFLNCGKGEKNTLAAEVSAGWWRDKIITPATEEDRGFLGKKSAFWGELAVEFADGSKSLVATGDEAWRCGVSGRVKHAAIFDGEEYDARCVEPVFGEGLGEMPEINDEFTGDILPSDGGEVVLREDLAIRRGPFSLKKGDTLVVDFAQNCAAVPKFTFRAPSGTVLTALPAEMLNDADAPRRGCDGPKGSVYRANLRVPREGMQVKYTFAGDGAETYMPRFTYFGYRYLAISATGDVEIDEVVSIPVSSIRKEHETGSLETGDAALNRFISNVYWGQLSNYLSVPTDCPQRNERLGWAADSQVFAEAGAFNADTSSFLRKYMRDLRDSQSADGGFPSVAPFAQYGNELFSFGWADAGVIIPWTAWRQFGDERIIRENWDAMARFVRRLDETKYDFEDRLGYIYADWLSYEKFESCGNSFGGWEEWKNDVDARNYRLFLAACYWLYDARLMEEMGRAIGKDDDAEWFGRSAARALSYIRARFLENDGLLLSPMRELQTACVFAIHFGIVEGAAREQTKQLLLDSIRAHDGCLQTGFLGTSFILDALTECGAADAAYALLLQHKCPGWLYSVDQGATTVWERWNSYTKADGFGPVSMNSFNHYAYGAVLAWIYRTVAGIAPTSDAPGFRKVVMAPRPDRRLGWIKAEYKSANGVIRSAWRYDGNVWIWDFSIPEGMVADVTIPGDTNIVRYTSGDYSIRRDAAEYDVAAYVWPAYQPEPRWAELGIFGDGKGEWQNVYEAVPKWDGHRQPLVPLWGYENEADPKVMEKKIDAAVSHGVNVFIYDWYWYGGRPFLEDALDKGFLGAKNNDKMGFFIMWANHNVCKLWDNKAADKKWNEPTWLAGVDEDEFRKISRRWMEMYFSRPNYYRIGGKPVLMIYEIGTFIEGLGGLDKAAKAMAEFRKACEEAGLGGVHLMACDCGIPKDAVAALGIDSASIYNFVHWASTDDAPDYAYWAEAAARRFDTAQKDLGLGMYFAHASVGWDTNPRYPVYAKLSVAKDNTPANFETVLRRAKEWTDRNAKAGQPKLITVNSWNEWTEGSYLEPDTHYGFGYLEAVKKVFGTTDKTRKETK